MLAGLLILDKDDQNGRESTSIVSAMARSGSREGNCSRGGSRKDLQPLGGPAIGEDHQPDGKQQTEAADVK